MNTRDTSVAEDRSEIEQLLFRYAHTFDAGDFDGFAALFATGTLHLTGIGPPATGVAEVLAFLDSRVIMYDGVPRTNHLIHNSLIDVAPDRASATAASYVQVIQSIPGGPIETIVTGIYHDELRRDDATGWRFHTRRAEGSLNGNLRNHLRSQRST
jgi:hypothetical protein